MAMELRSPAFEAGASIPARDGCEGGDVSPPFEGSGVPEGAAALTLTCADPDAPRGTFRDWALLDIPAALTGLAEGQAMGDAALDDFGRPGHGGRCRPRGDRPHRHVVRLAAPSDRVVHPAGAGGAEAERLARPLAIAAATLTGLFGR